MFVGITNTPRDYAWGSQGAISELLGTAPSGAPEAELWLGAHPGSPSRLVGSDGTLPDVIDGRLPFLLKVLAAASPLSLQAHPTMEQATAGFSRENAAGIPLDAANRNYADAFHKPELLYALSDEFHALCGFRPVAQTRRLLAPLAADSGVAPLLDRLIDDSSVRPVFEWLINRADGVASVFEALIAALVAHDGAGQEWQTVRSLAERYPGDSGIAISLMLNRVTLRRGQVLYLPAGNIHAYLGGLGIELMAASDNVLRGGLTAKYIDLPELLAVLDFTPGEVAYLRPDTPSAGVEIYRPEVPDFVLVALNGAVAGASYALCGPAIALCTAGEFRIVGAVSTTLLSRGESVYVTPDEGTLGIDGDGTLFLATGGARTETTSIVTARITPTAEG